MAKYKDLFIAHLEEEGIKYTDVREFVVKIVYTGDNLKTIPVHVYFDEDGDPLVQLKCWEIASASGKREQAIDACNKINNDYRWVKYCVDEDDDIIASVDAYIDEYTCGKFCLNLVRRVVNITDEAYPTFMRSLWS